MFDSTISLVEVPDRKLDLVSVLNNRFVVVKPPMSRKSIADASPPDVDLIATSAIVGTYVFDLKLAAVLPTIPDKLSVAAVGLNAAAAALVSAKPVIQSTYSSWLALFLYL